jgi:hypothetical protein
MKTKILKEAIFWLLFIAVIYLVFFMGQHSINPLKWKSINYDDIHGIPLWLRLIGMFSSLIILTIFCGIVDVSDKKKDVEKWDILK